MSDLLNLQHVFTLAVTLFSYFNITRYSLGGHDSREYWNMPYIELTFLYFYRWGMKKINFNEQI